MTKNLKTKNKENKMNKIQHTPGPWIISQTNDDPKITDVGPEWSEKKEDSFWCLTVYAQDEVPLERHRKNVALIAAAPELLEALLRIFEACQTTDYRNPAPPGIIADIARAAIAKAKGEV